MNTFWKLISLPALSVLLSACGGNQEEVPQKNVPPISQAIDGKQFIALTTNTSCSNTRNRLFIIDQKYVFWDKAGSCANASYAQTLFGATPNVSLCSNMDSIAGAKLVCEDNTLKSLFTTMINNLDKTNLGLDQSHQVQPFITTSGALASFFFQAINASFYRGPAPLNIIIKDKNTWDQFWKSAQISPPIGSTANNNNNFQNIMVLGVFYKTQNDCSLTHILKLVSNGQKLVAEYIEEERVAITRCDPNALSSTPMSLIETSSLELPIEFSNVSSNRIAFQTIDETLFSTINSEKNILIKDQLTWQKLWEEHKNNNSNAPYVDFKKNMIAAILLGKKSCFGVENLNIWSSNSTINVAYHNPLPGPATLCTTAVLTPAMIVQIPRSDLAVEFNSILIKK